MVQHGELRSGVVHRCALNQILLQSAAKRIRRRGMAFIRTRTIKGQQYRYLEERWREGKRVRSRSTYLGKSLIGEGLVAFGSFFSAANLRSDGVRGEEASLREQAERDAEREAAQARALEALHEAYGMKMGESEPTPAEKDAPPDEGEAEGLGDGLDG